MRGHYEMALSKLPSMKLEALLDDNDPKIRAVAARSLGKLPPSDLEPHVARLAECFTSDSDNTVRKECVKAFGNLPHLDALRLPDLLVECFAKASDEELRRHCALTLTKLPSVELVERLPPLLGPLFGMSASAPLTEDIRKIGSALSRKLDDAMIGQLSKAFDSIFEKYDTSTQNTMLHFACSVPVRVQEGQLAEIAKIAEEDPFRGERRRCYQGDCGAAGFGAGGTRSRELNSACKAPGRSEAAIPLWV